MWKLFGFVALIGSCLAAPKPDEIDSLIQNVFPPPPVTTEKSGGGSLDSLITQSFGNGNRGSNTNDDKFNNANDPGDPPECVCVPYFNCNANGTVDEDGKNIIDVRMQDKVECQGSLDVCCIPPDVREKPIKPPPETARKGCGQHRPDGVGFRITGAFNNEAGFGEFPWMVAVLSGQKFGATEEVKSYECGGSLIHPSVVLTAAHCVINKSDKQFMIRAGEWDTQTKSEPYPHQNRVVDRIVIHPNYKEGSLHNDYALLIVAQPVNIAENVDIVCLPDSHAVFDHSKCLASGWGKNEFGKNGAYMVVLKKIDLPVVPHDACQRNLRTTRLGNYFRLDRSFICAGGEAGKDTCKGDGGSPLVCPLGNEPNRYVQAGIVSWGIGCGDNQIPGVYANVAAARPWIDEVMAYNNFDNTVYQYTPQYVF